MPGLVAGKGAALLEEPMGVLGADGINGAVSHRLQQSLAIRRTAQGRNHMTVAVEAFQG